MPGVRWPFGAADRKVLTGADLASPVVIDNMKTVIVLSTLAANVTLNLTIDSELPEGAELVVEVTQGATGRNVIPGTGFAATVPTLTGDANDVDCIKFVLDGAASGSMSFKATQTWAKVQANP